MRKGFWVASGKNLDVSKDLPRRMWLSSTGVLNSHTKVIAPVHASARSAPDHSLTVPCDGWKNHAGHEMVMVGAANFPKHRGTQLLAAVGRRHEVATTKVRGVLSNVIDDNLTPEKVGFVTVDTGSNLLAAAIRIHSKYRTTMAEKTRYPSLQTC